MVSFGFWIENGFFWFLTFLFFILRIIEMRKIYRVYFFNQKLSTKVKLGQITLTVVLCTQIVLAIDMHNFFGVFQNLYIPWILSCVITSELYVYIYVFVYLTSNSLYFVTSNKKFALWFQVFYISGSAILLALSISGFSLAAATEERCYLLLSYITSAVSFTLFGSFYTYFVFLYRSILQENVSSSGSILPDFLRNSKMHHESPFVTPNKGSNFSSKTSSPIFSPYKSQTFNPNKLTNSSNSPNLSQSLIASSREAYNHDSAVVSKLTFLGLSGAFITVSGTIFSIFRAIYACNNGSFSEIIVNYPDDYDPFSNIALWLQFGVCFLIYKQNSITDPVSS